VAVGVAQFATFKTRSMYVDVQDHLLSCNVTEWTRAFLKAELMMLVTGKYLQHVISSVQPAAEYLPTEINAAKSSEISQDRRIKS